MIRVITMITMITMIRVIRVIKVIKMIKVIRITRVIRMRKRFFFDGKFFKYHLSRTTPSLAYLPRWT